MYSKGLIRAVTEICTLQSLQGEPECQDGPQCSSGPKVGRLEAEDKSMFQQESAGRKKKTPDSPSEAGRQVEAGGDPILVVVPFAHYSEVTGWIVL